MNRNILIIMGGALAIAIIVAMVVQAKLAPKQAKQDAPGTEILIANKTLLTGEVLKSADVRWEQRPDNTLFKGVIKRKEQPDENNLEVYNKPLRRPIESGEAVTTQALVTAAKGSGNFLSAAISPGMRAASIAIKAETAAGGFVAPGDYVDVIMTYQVSLKGDAARYSAEEVQKYASETILSNVRVLAVDQNAKEDTREVKVARTVTIEVTKEGAQILAMATTMGNLSIALRRLGEKDTPADQSAPLTTDVTTSKVIQEIYKTMNKSKTTSDTVRIYSGSAVTNVPVRATTGP